MVRVVLLRPEAPFVPRRSSWNVGDRYVGDYKYAAVGTLVASSVIVMSFPRFRQRGAIA